MIASLINLHLLLVPASALCLRGASVGYFLPGPKKNSSIRPQGPGVL